VVRPFPLETRWTPEPSPFITYCWSQGAPSRVDWKMSSLPSKDQYASAFSPPKESWRTLARWRSPGRTSEADGLGAGTAGVGAGIGGVDAQAARARTGSRRVFRMASHPVGEPGRVHDFARFSKGPHGGFGPRSG
jgi:hypothetical protein